MRLFSIAIIACLMSGCAILRSGSKHAFDDGVYQTKRVTGKKVYVLHVDDDTIAVFPVLEFKDSTAILTNKRTNYTSTQRKFKDKKTTHTFYKPSADVDLMTIPLKYRPASEGVPNQINTNFDGAVFVGYRIDQYRLNYKRTPLNNYKQSIKHIGYSAGLFAGIGSAAIDGTVLNNQNLLLEYSGALFIAGIAANAAVENITFGISFGPNYLLDQYHTQWIYEGKTCVGFTLGLNIN